MRRLHVVGRKNHGKTALVVALTAELAGRGLSVGTIKHAGHDHEIDTPGRDSHRHREAGGAPAAIVTPGRIGVFAPRPLAGDPYAWLAPLYAPCEVVLVEGDHEGPAPKIEVWRAAAGGAPLAASRTDIAALVTDDPVAANVPVWPRADVPALADRVLALLRGDPGGRPAA